MQHFGGNFEKSRLILRKLGLMKRLLSRSRFLRHLNRLIDLIHSLFHQLESAFKELHRESSYLLDSFPIAVCDNIRLKDADSF
jgi:hypothetical protein